MFAFYTAMIAILVDFVVDFATYNLPIYRIAIGG
jgi:hypothetical protein